MEEAINVLPVKWEQSEYGRATRGAAVALRGKVKLFNRDYSGAATDFEEVVNDPSGRGYGYKLYDSYPDLFKPEGDCSDEMILLFRIPVESVMTVACPLGFIWVAVLLLEVAGTIAYLQIF